jgi:DNA invertase Pin-like site-specific DNA recombinase
LQYDLVERAVALGWPRNRVAVIDDDLGQSASVTGARGGFQRLIAEVSLARVGIVLSWDASRLARNSGDWHQLLELCGLFGTLLADGERLYDPVSYHDRLLLGLSGMMSEAELHQLKQRLQAGARHKAERGELPLPLPVGLLRLPDRTVVLDPDEEVQARIRLVLAKFAELGTAKAVVRYCQRAGLPLPARPVCGPAPWPLRWEPARGSRVLAILKNPAYAGAYVFGRTARDPTRRRPGHPQSGVVRRPLDECPVVLQDIYPAYLSWADFLQNQRRLRDNQSRYREARPGVPRRGQALLQGIALCGQCGRRMHLSYSGPGGDSPVYKCSQAATEYGGPACQEVRALAVDAAVEALVLAALAPDRLAVALAAVEELAAEDRALGRQWQLRVERARYEAQRAERQYQACEPENRLVARTLEQQWEQALRRVEQVEQEAAAWRRQQAPGLDAAGRDAILALGEDLPALWRASTTTPADRKRLLRLVVRDVALDQSRAVGQTWVQVNWQTGASTEHWVRRRVQAYAVYADLVAVQQQVRALAAAGQEDNAIAAALNAAGYQTARGKAYRGPVVWELRQRWGIAKPAVAGPAPDRPGVAAYSVTSAAAAVGVIPGTIYHWLWAGRLEAQHNRKGRTWAIYLSPEDIARLRVEADCRRPSKKEAL